MKTEKDIIKKIKELEEERELASDTHLKDKLSYGIYILEWMLRERRGCLDG